MKPVNVIHFSGQKQPMPSKPRTICGEATVNVVSHVRVAKGLVTCPECRRLLGLAPRQEATP